MASITENVPEYLTTQTTEVPVKQPVQTPMQQPVAQGVAPGAQGQQLNQLVTINIPLEQLAALQAKGELEDADPLSPEKVKENTELLVEESRQRRKADSVEIEIVIGVCLAFTVASLALDRYILLNNSAWPWNFFAPLPWWFVLPFYLTIGWVVARLPKVYIMGDEHRLSKEDNIETNTGTVVKARKGKNKKLPKEVKQLREAKTYGWRK